MIGYSWSAILSISLWGWEGCVVPRCLTSRLFSRASWPAILAPSHPRYSTDGTFLGLPLFFIKGCVSLFCPKLPRSTGVGVGAGLGAGVGVVVVVLFVDRAGAVVWAEPEVWFWVWVWTGTDVSWFELRVFDGVTSGGRSLGLRPLFLPVAPFFTSFLMPLLWGSIGFLLLAVMLVVARNQFWECVLLMWYFTPLSELNSFWHSRHMYFPTAPPALVQFAKWALSPDTLE